MRILFSWTGVTSYMADCWRLLQAQSGVELKIIVETADSGKEFAAAQTLKGLDFELVDQLAAATCEIRTLTSGFAPDVVFAGGWRSPTTRRVLDCYEVVPLVFCLDMPWRWSLRCIVARFALHGFVKRFDAVYVPGKSTAFYARWLGFPKDRIHRKLYAIDQRKFREAREKASGCRREGFLFIGRHSPEKRLDLIEKAHALYRAQGGTWSLDCYGQGGKFVQADGIPQIYAEHACLLLASSFDPWPLVMLEARAAGLEVIASDRCGNCDELGAHKVPYGDAAAMARKMLEVERGAQVPRRDDLADYACAAWVPRTLALAREVIAAAPQEANGMAVVDRLLREHGVIRADEAWVHGMWTPGKWWACLKAKLAGKKLVRMTHGSLSPIYLENQGKWKKRLVAPIERALFALSDRVVVTGPWEENWCRAWGIKGTIETLDLKQFFKIGAEGQTFSASFGRSTLHVLYLGRRHPLKGVEYLERAVGGMSVELHVVSDKFGEALEAEWRWADVLCLPTLSENFGLVVAEALERGKFVITTDGAPAWADLKPEQGIYLKGFCAGTDRERVELLAGALTTLVGQTRGNARNQ